MSNLIGKTLGSTVDYWWDRLAGHPYRWKFMFTKVIETWAYKTVPTKIANRPCSTSGKTRPRTRVTRQKLGSTPKVAVVVPALVSTPMHSRMLHRLLFRLGESTYPCEVIVVDDVSPRSIPEGDAVVLRNRHRRGPAASRNLGLAEAERYEADVIFLTDCDCVPDHTWIEAGVNCLRENPYAHIISGYTASFGNSWFDRYHEMNGTLNGRQYRGTGRLLYGPTCNLVLRRIVFKTVRFDETFPDAACEDIDFCCRCADEGFLILSNPKMRVRHDYGYGSRKLFSNLRRMVRQFQRYARAENLLLHRVPDYFTLLGQTESIPIPMFR